MNVDTSEMAAFTEELDELGREVADHGARTDRLAGLLTELLQLVTPLLRGSAEHAKHHAAVHAAQHHPGRHRAPRRLPGCGDGQ